MVSGLEISERARGQRPQEEMAQEAKVMVAVLPWSLRRVWGNPMTTFADFRIQ